MFGNETLNTLLFHWITKSLALVLLIVLTYYVFIRASIIPYIRARLDGRFAEIPVGSVLFFVALWVGWAVYCGTELTFRKTMNIENKSSTTIQEFKHQLEAISPSDKDSVEDQIQEEIRRANEQNKEAVRQFQQLPDHPNRKGKD